MQCNKPIFLRQYDFFVPCGKCMACRIARSREWSIRLLHEMDYFDESVFVTLTYNDENLPVDGNVSKDVLQRFFKRLRKRLDGRSIKYFACGEYGEKNGRPHYHAIILGLSVSEHVIDNSGGIMKSLDGPINDAWNMGFVTLGFVSYESCRYVSEYITKQLSGRMAVSGRVQPFSLKSNGIGRRYVEDNKTLLEKELSIRYKGIPLGLPKYYRNLLEVDSQVLYEKGKERLEELKEFYVNKYGEENDKIFDKVKLSRIQGEKNIFARTNIRKGKL